MDIVLKDLPMDPSENLTRLSQFVGAYATKNIDKATEVQIPLREKEKNIMLLEQQLEQEKYNQQAKLHVASFSRILNRWKYNIKPT